MIRALVFLADATLPDPLDQKIEPITRSTGRLPPAFVGLAVVALVVVSYLVWDFCRQKREERRQRRRLERFREQKFKEAQGPPVEQRPSRPQG